MGQTSQLLPESVPCLTYYMKADDEPKNRLECGEKEQGGTPSGGG